MLPRSSLTLVAHQETVRSNLFLVCLFGFDLLSLCTTPSIDSAKCSHILRILLVTDIPDTCVALSGQYYPHPEHCGWTGPKPLPFSIGDTVALDSRYCSPQPDSTYTDAVQSAGPRPFDSIATLTHNIIVEWSWKVTQSQWASHSIYTKSLFQWHHLQKSMESNWPTCIHEQPLKLALVNTQWVYYFSFKICSHLI